MSVKFRLVQKKNMMKGAVEGSKLYYPVLVGNGTVSFSDLCDEVAEQSSLTSGDVKNCVDRLIYAISNHLSNGRTVDAGDIGRFRVSLRSSGAATAETYSVATNMRQPRVIYTPGKRLRGTQSNATFSRVIMTQTTVEEPSTPTTPDDNEGPDII